VHAFAPDKDATADTPVVSLLVFDLVLYQGQWVEGKKDGDCKHFLCYRNCYFPKYVDYKPEQKEDDYNFLSRLGNIPGRTTVDDILRNAQLLSGCFFSGRLNQDNLCSGSLFYFHRRFCLLFEGNGSNDQKWLEGKVTYVDCSSGSSFSEVWVPTPTDKKKKAIHTRGIWGMGCNLNKEVLDDQGEVTAVINEGYQRSSHKVSSPIEFKDGAAHMDVKDGLPGRIVRVFKVCLIARMHLLLHALVVSCMFVPLCHTPAYRPIRPFTCATVESACLKGTACSPSLPGPLPTKFGTLCGSPAQMKSGSPAQMKRNLSPI
jgi:hypothetical protein